MWSSTQTDSSEMECQDVQLNWAVIILKNNL